ncbi:Amino acid transporter [Francisella cf. novicida Fx1]|uniref:APC family permease n=1 Tax=Francisella tularensis TaxID=263 RepID=UPI00020BCE89|nr:APC family permease [Francisella tularensis]AEE87313.1 Amino acid transporter [Francisella cf. novicida Fx1]
MKKLSTMAVVFISTGGMIGSGWLFSPYYGFQTAGQGVIISWFITALLTLLVALCFAEVASMLPIVSGAMRFLRITHSRTLGFLFVALGWISYLVYLPLEAQSVVQYLGFWFPNLVVTDSTSVYLSYYGVFVAFIIMLSLTYLNTYQLKNVAKINSIVSIWKIFLPIAIAVGMLAFYGSFKNYHANTVHISVNFEHILLAVTGSGLAFAFSGFQNGLIVANSAKNPRLAIPLSLIAPVVVGLTMYISLSLLFMFCVPESVNGFNAGVAPLLGLLSLFSLHIIYTILFIDAIVAPLGTGNVYTAVTGRVLQAFGLEFFKKSVLTRLNKNHVPIYCIWINFFVGLVFLFQFPTWTALVNFLSSLVLFSCLSGPVVLIVFRDKFSHIERKFKLPYYQLFGYLGFISCSYFIYWSGTFNLLCLVILVALICLLYWFIFMRQCFASVFKQTWFVCAYIISLWAISYIHELDLVNFPYDNLLVAIVSIIFLKIFIISQADTKDIEENIKDVMLEVENLKSI